MINMAVIDNAHCPLAIALVITLHVGKMWVVPALLPRILPVVTHAPCIPAGLHFTHNLILTLTLIPTLTLLSLLTLLNHTNPNCASKTTKLASFFNEQAHRTITTMPHLRMHCIMPISLR